MGVGTDYDRLYVTGRPGTGTSALHEEVARVVHAVQPDAIVQDADEVIARRAVSSVGGGTTTTTVLNLLAPVCALVAGGGLLVALGVLAALPLLVTAVVGLIGRLGGEGRYPLLHLAARDLARNPGRSTATAATLLIGVMVGSTLAVGLFSFSSSFQSILAQSSPVDITVLGVTPQTDTAALTSTIRGIDGVQSTAVVRSTKGLEDLDDSTLIVGQIYDVPDGTRVTLTGPGGSVELTARVREGWGAAVTTATAARLAGVGGALGVVTGTALGAAGTLAALVDGGVSIFVPYLPLAGVLAITLAVGVLASLRPARRAAAVTPVTALAAD